jgi:murein tripeptide amidase MpaA
MAIAPAAHAATVTVPEPAERTCQARALSESTPGVAHARYTAGSLGAVTARLTGSSGDWDLALFDAGSGRLLNASATATRRERADAIVPAGTEVVAQACRRTGRGATAQLAFDLYEMEVPTGPRFAPTLVRVALGPGRTHERLEATGLDVTHNVQADGADVVLYSAAERAKLLAAGFTYETIVADLRAADLATFRADRAYARRISASALPSGRTGYRTYAEYGTDLKAIVDKHPSFARRIEIGRSLEDRPIEGVELAGNVNGRDGRPLFAVLGAHHAREWPSAEMPMEFATDLAKGYGKDPRITSLLDRVRVVVLPLINPDGFNVSRTAGETPFDDTPPDPITGIVSPTTPAILTDTASYKRKNCRATVEAEQDAPCISRPAAQGVDLNRNYGAYWGGVGSDPNPAVQQYRGPAPYSEPESESFHKLSSTRVITNVITHHTYTAEGEWLRQPGFCPKADKPCPTNPSDLRSEYPPGEQISPDEAGQKSLGMAMGEATGWFSNVGWIIGQITGATEDWNYFTQGAYGYTPEQRGPNFHPDFETSVVKEYDGTAPGAKGGVGEALLLAGELAANPSYHSVLLGVAPAGRTLRLRKAFDTPTSNSAVPVVKDQLDFTTVVPDSGFYTWHVNQSTRPLSTAPEAYTLTCESGGQVIETRQVIIGRGEAQALDLACGASLPNPPTPDPTPPVTPPPGQFLCADTRAPVSSVTRGSLRISRKRVLVRGRASDHGCQASGSLLQRRGQLARVLVAVALRERKRCRFLRPNGTLSGRRSCSRALYLPARGLGSFSLKARGKLPRGRYHVWSQSTDTSGNLERKRRRILGGTVR